MLHRGANHEKMMMMGRALLVLRSGCRPRAISSKHNFTAHCDQKTRFQALGSSRTERRMGWTAGTRRSARCLCVDVYERCFLPPQAALLLTENDISSGRRPPVPLFSWAGLLCPSLTVLQVICRMMRLAEARVSLSISCTKESRIGSAARRKREFFAGFLALPSCGSCSTVSAVDPVSQVFASAPSTESVCTSETFVRRI